VLSVRQADLLAGFALSLPWIVAPLATAWRAADSRSLDEESAEPPAEPPLVSVIVPARDEAANIGRCLRSVLATTWPRLEVIVVDDHSRDATAAIAGEIAMDDRRARVIAAPALPPGWFGKPWACHAGARAARGEILCFIDADTVHSPDLLMRTVNAMRTRGAGMVTVAGTQEMSTFWETVLQTQVFAMLAMRYGGTETVNRSRRSWDKIANGQFIAITRTAYDAIGGHAAVRDRVAEDLMLAQRLFEAGQRTALVLGTAQLSTRMYTSLGAIVRGWRKNVFAGGIDAVPPHPLLRLAFPLGLTAFPAAELLPPLVLATWLSGAALPATALVWLASSMLALVAGWTAVYLRAGRSPLYALTFPLGAAVLLWIFAGAIRRGRRVSWKGRDYDAGAGGA
jgi:cellulose synthase/poly-beta-1,6-N-acetylglucosamine synthase-like glycosyltransferase